MPQPARMNYDDRKPGPTPTPKMQTKPISSTSAPKGFGNDAASAGKIASGQSQMAKKCEMGINSTTDMNKFGIH